MLIAQCKDSLWVYCWGLRSSVVCMVCVTAGKITLPFWQHCLKWLKKSIFAISAVGVLEDFSISAKMTEVSGFFQFPLTGLSEFCSNCQVLWECFFSHRNSIFVSNPILVLVKFWKSSDISARRSPDESFFNNKTTARTPLLEPPWARQQWLVPATRAFKPSYWIVKHSYSPAVAYRPMHSYACVCTRAPILT